MSLIKQLAGQTVVYGLSTILPRILHFLVFTVYLTNRALADETATFGIYSDLYAYAGILLVLMVYRIDTAYFRYGSKSQDENVVFSTAAISLIASTLLFVLILLLFRQSIAVALTYPEDAQYVSYFAFIIGLDALAALPLARLRLMEKAKLFAVIKIAQVIINLVLVFVFLELFPHLIDMGYTDLSAYYSDEHKLDLLFIANLLASAVVLLFLLPQYRHMRISSFSKQVWYKMIIFLLPLVVVAAAGVFNQSFAVPLIKYFLHVPDVENQMGLYSAAAKIAILMNLFTIAFNYAAEPFFFKQATTKAAKQTYAEVAQAFALAASVVLLGILLYLDVLQHLIGQEYRKGLTIVPVLLLAFWLLGLYYNLSVWYKINDLTKYGAMISLVGVVVTLVVTVVFINSLGKIALAWAAVACYATMNILSYVLGRKHYPVAYPMLRILSYLAGAFVFYGIHNLLVPVVPLPNLVLSSVLMVLYILVLVNVEKKSLKAWLT